MTGCGAHAPAGLGTYQGARGSASPLLSVITNVVGAFQVLLLVRNNNALRLGSIEFRA